MNNNKTPFCKVPFLIGFTTRENRYRDCCSKNPRTLSDNGQEFQQWWNSDKLNKFRQRLLDSNDFPRECWSCEVAEKNKGNGSSSFRTAVNKWDNTDFSHPAGWNIIFGNTCNLACWMCNENSSSVIFQHKKRAGLLSGKDDTNADFIKFWPGLRKNILKSYEHHETVNLTMLGGEPLYNKIVIDFLEELIDMKLAHRTKLEFHTNGTVYPDKVLPSGEPSPWQQVCVFISLDAVGPYAEWLRYGCNWKQVDKIVDALIERADYTEMHCTLTVLNINQLADLESYAKSKKCKLSITPTDHPEYMAIQNWDLSVDDLLVNPRHDKYTMFYDLIGTTPEKGASDRLVNYIRKFDGVRRPLREFDENFAQKIGW